MKVQWSGNRLGKEEKKAVLRVLGKDFSGFSAEVRTFEGKVKEITGARHAIACMNGTAALMVGVLALRKLVETSLLIHVPTWTYIAPANVADLFGCLSLEDCDRDTLTIMKQEDEKNVTLPVDMGGVPADYDSLGGYVIADAAESLGATYKGRKVGTLGDISVTSFHSSKVMVTGEGGMIFTESDDLANFCRALINQGYSPQGYSEHIHVTKGFNFRMTGMQAAIGIVQASKFGRLLSERQKKERIYREELGGVIEFQKIPEGCTSSGYSVTIFSKKRDYLKSYLEKEGIEAKIWRPVHTQDPYRGPRFPNADYRFPQNLRLPINNELTEEQILFVCEKVKEALRK